MIKQECNRYVYLGGGNYTDVDRNNLTRGKTYHNLYLSVDDNCINNIISIIDDCGVRCDYHKALFIRHDLWEKLDWVLIDDEIVCVVKNLSDFTYGSEYNVVDMTSMGNVVLFDDNNILRIVVVGVNFVVKKKWREDKINTILNVG